MRGLLGLGAALILVAPAPSPSQDVAEPAGAAAIPVVSAKCWLGRHAEFEEFLRSAPIDRIEKVGEGVTNPDRAYFAPGGLAESAVVKILPPKRSRGFWESYRSEIAAYELDRLLGLDMVPVTVERRIKGERSSVQLWLNGCRLLRQAGTDTPPRPREWGRQVCRQRIFDALSANIDRNSGNILIDGEWNLILIDHSRAFIKNQTPHLDEIVRADRQIYDALKALDEESLNERVQPWLFGKSSVKELLERRDKIVGKLDKLLQDRGEASVFPFEAS
jgi:hypothetical protein